VNTGEEKLSESSLLSDEFVRELVAVGEVDLLVGIPSLNDAKTIGHVAQAVEAGLIKYFPRQRVVLVNTDGGSRDGTERVFRNSALEGPTQGLGAQTLRTVHRVSTVYSGAPNAILAMRTILLAADLLRAKACGIVSAELTSINPAWIDNLLRPVYKDQFDLATPVYDRPKFDGLLVTNLLYPALRALYGKQLYEPLATEFALSGRMVSQVLEEDFWREPEELSRPEIWITTLALVEGLRVCQSFLGPRVLAEKNSQPDVVETIRRAVGTLFRCLDTQASSWLANTGSQAIPTLGFRYEVNPRPIRVNRKRMVEMFRNGVTELGSILEIILAPATLREIQHLARSANGGLDYSDELWVKTVFDFAGAYHRSVMDRDHIVQALAPLYRGRMASFILKNQEATLEEYETAIERLCEQYERLRPYLLRRWKEREVGHGRDDR